MYLTWYTIYSKGTKERGYKMTPDIAFNNYMNCVLFIGSIALFGYAIVKSYQLLNEEDFESDMIDYDKEIAERKHQ